MCNVCGYIGQSQNTNSLSPAEVTLYEVYVGREEVE